MEFLTKDEVAKSLQVHPRTIDRWLKKSALRGYKLGKGKTSLWRIAKADLEVFLAKHKN